MADRCARPGRPRAEALASLQGGSSMNLFDWFFRREPPPRQSGTRAEGSSASQRANRTSSNPNSAPCPQYGTTASQTRADGRCVGCGTLLPQALRFLSATTPHGVAPGVARRSKLPRPADVKQLAENSPMVAFQQGGVTVMMDTDAFDYTYGDAEGPDPAQRDLDALLTRATRICVLEGPMFQGRAVGGQILLDLRGANALRDLASCLQIVEDPRTFNHCQCLGGPTMELYAGLEHIATIGLQHGKAIRWKQWYHDAQLQDGDRLTRWMIDRGVDPAQLEAIYRRGNNFLFAKPSDSPDRVKVA